MAGERTLTVTTKVRDLASRDLVSVGKTGRKAGGSIALAGSLPPDDCFMVQKIRAAGGIAGSPSEVAAVAVPATAIDPICGMTVDVADARFVSEIGGETHYFCCPACKKQFETANA